MRKMEKLFNNNFMHIFYLWLNTKNNIKIQSLQKYKKIGYEYFVNEIINKKINHLKTKDFEIFFQSLNGNNVSLSVQKTLLYIIKAVLNFAYANKILLKKIDLNCIKIKKKEKFIYTLSIDEQKKIESELKSNINIRKCCLLVCLYTGLRVGEICGLKWENVNFNAKTIEIKRTIQRVYINDGNSKTKLIESTPKSDTSNRIIPVPNFIIEYLKKFKDKQEYYILSNSNKLYDPRLLQSFYRRILLKLNINLNKFHTLRHTFATRAIESKMDIKTLSEILGHSSVDITLKLYVHSSVDLKRKSIENIVDYMTTA